jgi:ABC-type microcin C transport system duplicated ATPase subunit YejF
MQMVFQDPFGAFNPRMTVLEIVSEALRVYEPQLNQAAMRARVGEVLRQVGLDDDILRPLSACFFRRPAPAAGDCARHYRAPAGVGAR